MPSFSIMLYLWKATGVLLTVNAGARRAGALSILKSCHAITAANFASQSGVLASVPQALRPHQYCRVPCAIHKAYTKLRINYSGTFGGICASILWKTLHVPPGSSIPFINANLLSIAHIIESS